MHKKYHIWTEGCQMNVADSQRVGSSLEHFGYTFTDIPDEADVIVLNTCVVRQSAEDKAIGRVSSLAPLKKKNPNLVINLMGCLVGVRGAEKLKARMPYVDVFSPPSDPGRHGPDSADADRLWAHEWQCDRLLAALDGLHGGQCL